MTAIFLIAWNYLKGIWNWYWKTATLKTKLIILAGIAGIIVLGYILWQNHQISDLHKTVQDQNFNRQMVNVDTLTNQIDELEKQGNVLSNNKNSADVNRNAVIGRDSNSFSGSDLDAKFCKRYPNDSSCIEYCKTHQCR